MVDFCSMDSSFSNNEDFSHINKHLQAILNYNNIKKQDLFSHNYPSNVSIDDVNAMVRTYVAKNYPNVKLQSVRSNWICLSKISTIQNVMSTLRSKLNAENQMLSGKLTAKQNVTASRKFAAKENQTLLRNTTTEQSQRASGSITTEQKQRASRKITREQKKKASGKVTAEQNLTESRKSPIIQNHTLFRKRTRSRNETFINTLRDYVSTLTPITSDSIVDNVEYGCVNIVVYCGEQEQQEVLWQDSWTYFNGKDNDQQVSL